MSLSDILDNNLEASHRPKLLIVDDQPLNVRMLYQIFQDDYEVFIATTGSDALTFCQSDLPDLILLDVIMPVMDGYEVCRQLKQEAKTREIPVIFITGHNNAAEEEHGLEVGAVDFISKAASHKVIKARVKTHLTLKYQTDLLRSLTLIDSLTGVANRKHFDETFEAEWRRCAREVKPLSLIMIDIDFFKRYNDRYGHQAGDICLQRIAACIKACFTRSHDLTARYSGEEFVCILPDTPLEGAEAKAQLLQSAVRKLSISHESSSVEGGIMTVSIGVASLTPHHEYQLADLPLTVDRMLYEAKQAGRDKVKSIQL